MNPFTIACNLQYFSQWLGLYSRRCVTRTVITMAGLVARMLTTILLVVTFTIGPCAIFVGAIKIAVSKLVTAWKKHLYSFE